MKKILLITALAGFILTSCQKAQDDQLFSTTVNISADSTSKVSGWQTVGLQAGVEDGKGSKQAAAGISEAAVSSEVLSTGAVLLFGRKDGQVFLMPTTQGAATFSYEVSASSIGVQVSSRESVPETLEVLYVVLSAAQIDNVEKAGVSRDELFNLSYEKAQVLFSIP